MLACAVRLLDRGFFRIGSEEYAVENETYGLATMRKEHVTIERRRRDGLRLPGQERAAAACRAIVDRARLRRSSRALKRRRGGGAELLAYKEGGRWRDVRSEDINAYLKEATGGDFSAKDFRTWNATVLAAVALAVVRRVAAHARRRASGRSARAVKEVARYLGNTPAVCRASYIDPRVFDAFDAGLTIRPALERVAREARAGRAADPPARARARRCSTCIDERAGSAGAGAARGLRRREQAPHRRPGA